jgi:hypothetical protein
MTETIATNKTHHRQLSLSLSLSLSQPLKTTISHKATLKPFQHFSGFIVTMQKE